MNRATNGGPYDLGRMDTSARRVLELPGALGRVVHVPKRPWSVQCLSPMAPRSESCPLAGRTGSAQPARADHRVRGTVPSATVPLERHDLAVEHPSIHPARGAGKSSEAMTVRSRRSLSPRGRRGLPIDQAA